MVFKMYSTQSIVTVRKEQDLKPSLRCKFQGLIKAEGG